MLINPSLSRYIPYFIEVNVLENALVDTLPSLITGTT